MLSSLIFHLSPASSSMYFYAHDVTQPDRNAAWERNTLHCRHVLFSVICACWAIGGEFNPKTAKMGDMEIVRQFNSEVSWRWVYSSSHSVGLQSFEWERKLCGLQLNFLMSCRTLGSCPRFTRRSRQSPRRKSQASHAWEWKPWRWVWTIQTVSVAKWLSGSRQTISLRSTTSTWYRAWKNSRKRSVQRVTPVSF